MAFVLSVAKLVVAMKLPGCPVCRRVWQSSNETMEIFLWENVNDPRIRGDINAAYGFCDDHTRLLVSRELSNSGIALGVNIIYEQISRIVRNDLEKLPLKAKPRSLFARLLRSGKTGSDPVLPAKNVCPACKLANQSLVNTLSTLFESLEKGVSDLREAYLSSDRLCFDHLRLGLEHNADRYPSIARFLVDDAMERLDQMGADMRAYIRKSNWEYRDEKLTPEENDAWQRMLVFLTGYPASVFTFKVPQFDQGEFRSSNGK